MICNPDPRHIQEEQIVTLGGKKVPLDDLNSLQKTLPMEECGISTATEIRVECKTPFANVRDNRDSNRKPERIREGHHRLHQRGQKYVKCQTGKYA